MCRGKKKKNPKNSLIFLKKLTKTSPLSSSLSLKRTMTRLAALRSPWEEVGACLVHRWVEFRNTFHCGNHLN